MGLFMIFTRVSDWAEVSEDGRYSVAAIKGKDGYSFEAWRRDRPVTCLGRFPDAKQARACCETDAERKVA